MRWLLLLFFFPSMIVASEEFFVYPFPIEGEVYECIHEPSSTENDVAIHSQNPLSLLEHILAKKSEELRSTEGEVYTSIHEPSSTENDVAIHSQNVLQTFSCAAARKPQPLTPKEYDALFIKNSTILESLLSKVIFGQEVAVKSISNAITRYAAGINDTNRPIATMLFCGPSGVGKTELVQQLNHILYGDTKNITCLNMSEYSEPHTISRLIGSPPGYIGYDQGGQLSNAIAKQPYSIILLDEVEKAHPQVLKFFLHLFDTGLFNSATGHQINCRKCIFIMTSNLAALDIVKLYREGFTYDEILQCITPRLMDHLSPELFNRVESILFVPLSDFVINSLVMKLLNEVKTRVYTNKKIHISFDQSLLDFFKKNGIDPLLGVRPLKRLIDKELTTLIAKSILEGKCKENDSLFCMYQDGYIIIEKR